MLYKSNLIGEGFKSSERTLRLVQVVDFGLEGRREAASPPALPRREGAGALKA